MRTAPNYTPVVGLRVRRLLGNEAGQIFTITDVRELSGGLFNIVGSYGNGERLNRDAERFELAEPPPAAANPFAAGVEVGPLTQATQFYPGQEVIISERVRDVDDHECEVAVDYIGQVCIVRDPPLVGERVSFSWNDGGNVWQLLPQYLDIVPVAAVQPLTVGDRVEIVGPFEGRYADIGSPRAAIGLPGAVIDLVPERQEAQVQTAEVDGSSTWYYPLANLHRVGSTPAAAATTTPLSFETAWRLARDGQAIGSIMDQLHDSLAKPIENLSRMRGDWGQLLSVRAILRLRRQVPNSYEEQIIKGRAFTESMLWRRVWAAAYQR